MATAKERRDALYDALQPYLAVPTIWAAQNHPAPAAKYAVLRLRSGPRARGMRDAIKETQDLTRASDVTITPADPIVEAATYTVEIDSVAFSYVAQSGDDASDVCDELADLVNADAVPVTATSDAGTLILEHDTAGDLFALETTDNLAGWTNNDAGHEMIQTLHGQREAMLQVEAISDVAEPPNDAATILEGAFDALLRPDVIAILDAAGIAVVERLEMQHVPDIIGGEQRTRSLFEMRFRYAIAIESDTGYVKSFEMDGDFEGADDDLDLDGQVFQE